MINSIANPLTTQITISAIVVAFIQWLKNSEWMPWLHDASDKANRTVAAILAAATAIGIHMTWAHGDVPGSYMISVSGLTLSGIGLGLWGFTKSFVFQELIYRNTVKSPAMPAPGLIGAAMAKKS